MNLEEQLLALIAQYRERLAQGVESSMVLFILEAIEEAEQKLAALETARPVNLVEVSASATRRRARGKSKAKTAGEYRLRLLEQSGSATHEAVFEAEADTVALTLGHLVWEACSDCYTGYEIWASGARIRKATRAVSIFPPSFEQLARARQERLLHLEETLQRSHACLSQSRRLLDKVTRLRGIVAADPSAS